jgi:hypothetical protein
VQNGFALLRVERLEKLHSDQYNDGASADQALTLSRDLIRRLLLPAACALIGAPLVAQARVNFARNRGDAAGMAPPPPPNVLLILLDDSGYGRIENVELRVESAAATRP